MPIHHEFLSGTTKTYLKDTTKSASVKALKGKYTILLRKKHAPTLK